MGEHPEIEAIRQRWNDLREQLSQDYTAVKEALRAEGLPEDDHFAKFMEAKHRYHAAERQSREAEAGEVREAKARLGLDN